MWISTSPRKYKCRLGITISLHAAGRSAITARFQIPRQHFMVMLESTIFSLKAPAYYPFIFCKQDFSSHFMNLDMQYFLTLTLQLGTVQELAMHCASTMGQARLFFSVLQRAGQRWKSEAG